LTALTSEFPALVPFVQAAATSVGMSSGIYEPMMSNSDHYNFARHGIPALRLVAGFDRPQSNIRHILTRNDTADKVEPAELQAAARLTATLLAQALTAEDAEIAALGRR
jgi:Zn-dependent M28 family amino/carboxypeptidase